MTIELLVPVEEARVLHMVALQVLIETLKVLVETLVESSHGGGLYKDPCRVQTWKWWL